MFTASLRPLPSRARSASPWLALLVCAGVTSGLAGTAAGQGQPLSIRPSAPVTASVVDFAFAPDGKRIVYIADRDTNDVFELYSIKTGGGPSLKLSAPLRTGGDVLQFRLAPRGSRVIYLASGGFAGRLGLFSVPIDGGPAVQLDPPREGTGVAWEAGLTTYAISPDGKRVVYLADPEVNKRYELYSVSVLGGASLKLHPPLPAFGDVFAGFQISPDGERVLFLADPFVDYSIELFSVPIEGGQPPVQLSSALVFGRQVGLIFHISPDSARVVFGADQETAHVWELFSAPLDGSAPAVKLNGPLVANGNVSTAGISSDGVTVVYMADAVIDEDPALFVVPIDGSAPPTQLGQPLYTPVGSDNFSRGVQFLLDGPAGRVVYQSDRAPDDAFKLYSVPQDGVSTAVEISGPMSAAGSLAQQYQNTPDGSRVVYIADELTDNLFELFSSTVDGGGGWVRLNAPLPRLHGLVDFLVSPEGSRVVYKTGYGGSYNNQGRLFSAPVDGQVQAIDLCGAFVPDGTVAKFAITPDGQHVLYTADQLTRYVVELFSVPIDGSQPPKRIVGF